MISIPPETQADSHIHRGCGAACLSVVYKTFGKEVPQAEIWPLVAKPNRFGVVSSTTHLMAQHAIGLGLSAVIVQARHPLQILRLCREGGIRAILNHRSHHAASSGHYTVLVDIDDRNVIVSDPAMDVTRRMSHNELLQLWQPLSPASEITGNILIGISADPRPSAVCEFCHTAIPPQVNCPRCQKPVGLRPGVLLGCIRDSCIARMWNYIACPACDFVFNERTKLAARAPDQTSASPRPPALTTPDLEPAFAQLDKFCGHMLSLPGAADHPDLKAQIDFIQANKEKLKLAQAEEISGINARIERLVAKTDESEKKAEERRKQAEQRNAPIPPLDGNALGRALLKDLGLL